MVPELRWPKYSGANTPVPPTLTSKWPCPVSTFVLYHTRTGTVNLPPVTLISVTRSV